MNTDVEVLMATYNGEEYIEEMLNSLLEQDDKAFTLRIRDDGSSDATVAIILRLAPKFGDRLILMDTDRPTGSAKGNFEKLMQACSARYILFADQDDVWTKDHVSVIKDLLNQGEAQTSSHTPVYAFTDTTPVNKALVPIMDSYFTFKGIDPKISRSVRKTIVCPPMLGCASGINRALLDLSLPVPTDRVTGHDWWALMLAASAGHIVWSMKSTALYRLHGGNASAQVSARLQTYAKFGNKAAKVRRGMMLRRIQAMAVRERLQHLASAENIAILDGFDQLMDKGFAQRRIALLSGGYLYPDITRNIGMLALC